MINIFKDIEFMAKKYINAYKCCNNIFNAKSGKEVGENYAELLNEFDDVYDKITGKHERKNGKKGKTKASKDK